MKRFLIVVLLGLIWTAHAEEDRKTILFLGDSLTAGYGLDKTQAFPALIQAKLDSLGWAFDVVNGGLSGETSAGGLRRVNWLLRRKLMCWCWHWVATMVCGGFPRLKCSKICRDYRSRKREVSRYSDHTYGY